MFTARITRKTGEKIVKDEMTTDELSELLQILINNYENEDDYILEIHILKGDKQ